MALSKKQRDFVDHYVAHWNASEAARRAGYSEKTAGQIGYENLKKPEIAREIEARIAELLPRGEVVQRIAARSRTSIADVLRLPATETPADGEEAPRSLLGDDAWQLDLVRAQKTGAIHQIKKLKKGKYGDEIEMHDPLPALELAARFLKLVGGDSTHKHIDLSKLTPEQLQRLADGDDLIVILLDTLTTPSAS